MGPNDSGENPSLTWGIGEFVLDVPAAELLGPDGPVRLRPKPLGVLLQLARRGTRVVSKDELIRAVWGRRPASDVALAAALRDLRRALGDHGEPGRPRYIETLRGRGYRLLAAAVPGPSAVDRGLEQLESALGEFRAASASPSVVALVEEAKRRLEEKER